MMSKNLAAVGVVLVVAGALALFYKNIPYTSRDVILDAGPIQATADTKQTWPLPPILGGLAIAGGIGLIVLGTRKS